MNTIIYNPHIQLFMRYTYSKIKYFETKFNNYWTWNDDQMYQKTTEKTGENVFAKNKNWTDNCTHNKHLIPQSTLFGG